MTGNMSYNYVRMIKILIALVMSVTGYLRPRPMGRIYKEFELWNFRNQSMKHFRSR